MFLKAFDGFEKRKKEEALTWKREGERRDTDADGNSFVELQRRIWTRERRR